MAIGTNLSTKLKLNSGKFEQIGTDTLSLSGTTIAYGNITIGSGATFVVKPNAGSGKVLTSDNVGTMTLQEFSSLSDFVLYGINIYTTLSNPTGITCNACGNVFLGVNAGNKTTSGDTNIGNWK